MGQINELYDKRSVLQVLGCLIKKPILLEEYHFESSDFSFEPFYELVYSSIYNLFQQNIAKIDAYAIDSFLSNYKKQYTIFELNKGLDYCETAAELAELDNFEYYYNRLKKFTYLRFLEERGFDTRVIYDSTCTDPSEQEKEMAKLDNTTIDEMIDKIDVNLTIEARLRFSSDSNKRGQLAGQGMRELKEKLKEEPEFGLPLQSPYLTTIARGARLKKVYLRSSNSGGGKAIPNSTIIPTPNGYRKVGDIRSGDYLFGKDGKPTKVLQIHPQPHKKQVYEITFKDGRKAQCCNEHLWEVYNASSHKWNTMSLQEIIDSIKEQGIKAGEAWRYSIPVNEGVQYEEKDYGIEPFIIGEYLDVFWETTDEFFLSSYEQRKRILAEFFKSHGYISTNGQTVLTMDNCETKDKIVELCRSMGLVVETVFDGIDAYNVVIEKRCDKLPIVDIKALDQYEDMTCFTVEAEDHLFLMNDYLVTHNTRTAMADMVSFSVPYFYDTHENKWVYTGFSEPALFISTELDEQELSTLVMSYVSGVNESIILDGSYTKEQEERVDKAIEYIEAAPLYFYVMNDFSIADIENVIRKYRREKGCQYFCFDYMHTSAKLITEIASASKGMKLREDMVLFLMSDRLKNLANELNIFILTMTQLNGTYKDNTIKDETMLAGAKSIINRLDLGEISLPISNSEMEAIKPILSKGMYSTPNLVRHIYKCRRGKLSHIRIFQHADLGTCRTEDLFVTDNNNVYIPLEITKLQNAEAVNKVLEEHSIDIDSATDEDKQAMASFIF